jgi:hypothetical protein
MSAGLMDLILIDRTGKSLIAFFTMKFEKRTIKIKETNCQLVIKKSFVPAIISLVEPKGG